MREIHRAVCYTQATSIMSLVIPYWEIFANDRADQINCSSAYVQKSLM